MVVVGSGYGGSILAARLAERGHSVCLLERGREWQPGDFPDDTLKFLGEIRSESRPLGLFDFQIGEDLDMLSGNGLGGTSLINASIGIQPQADVFYHHRWPAEIQAEARSGQLGLYFQRAVDMLHVDAEPAPRGEPAKVGNLRAAAKDRNGTHHLAPHAINFRQWDDAPNAENVHQRLCSMCGDCIAGCNWGAKNTLAMNYLPRARRLGAEIYTGMEVDFLCPADEGGYFLHLREHREKDTTVERVVHARTVILSAGVLGSTAILLRSAQRGLPVSPRVGHHMSTNGDQLGFGYNNDSRTDVLGFGYRFDQRARLNVGPTIASYVEYGRDGPVKDRFVILEGAIPSPLFEIARRLGPTLALVERSSSNATLRDRAHDLARVVRDQIGYDPLGALNHTMVFLGVGHDEAEGRILLDGHGRPRLLWGSAPEAPVLQRISDEMRALVEASGGTYVPNPRWQQLTGRNAVTVHPLGGCPMGVDAEHGVVNHAGQAHAAGGGLLDGLYVCDGSIIPTSLGVNPMLTISALAERIAERFIQDHPEPIRPHDRPLAVPVAPAPPLGLEFTEELHGHWSRDVRDADNPEDYRRAADLGNTVGARLDFRVTIVIDDLPRFLASSLHDAKAEGHVDGAFGIKRRINEGSFNLFVDDRASHGKRMTYRLLFRSPEQERYTLTGYKVLREEPGENPVTAWAQCTTLYATIRSGWNQDEAADLAAPVLGQGMLHLNVTAFLAQLTTFRVRNSPDDTTSATWLARFGSFFFGSLWEIYAKAAVSE